MTISFVDFTDSGGAGASSVSAVKPTGVTSGDKMFAFANDYSNTGLTLGAPAGWTQIGSTLSNSSLPVTYALFFKDDDGTAGPYAFTTTGISLQVVIVAYRGAAAGAVDQSHPQSNTSNSTLAPNTGVTPSVAGETIIFGCRASAAVNFYPSAYSLRTNRLAFQTTFLDSIGAAGGATGDPGMTLASSSPSATWMLALAPATPHRMKMVV